MVVTSLGSKSAIVVFFLMVIQAYINKSLCIFKGNGVHVWRLLKVVHFEIISVLGRSCLSRVIVFQISPEKREETQMEKSWNSTWTCLNPCDEEVNHCDESLAMRLSNNWKYIPAFIFRIIQALLSVEIVCTDLRLLENLLSFSPNSKWRKSKLKGATQYP